MDVLTRDPSTPDDARWLPAADVLTADPAVDQRLDAIEAEQAADDTEQAETARELADLYTQLQQVALRPDDDEDEEARAQIAALLTRVTALEQATPTPTGPAPATNDISLSTVLPSGATDNDRLTEALRLQALDPARVIRLDYRDHGRVLTRTNVYNGKPPRIVGPCVGLVNPEQGIKAPVLITVNVGDGASSWFVGAGTTFNPLLMGVAIKCDTGASQLWHHPYTAGTAYAATFHDVTLFGFKHGWGKPGDGFAATLCKWSGAIQFPGIKDTALTLRGSDNWYDAVTNLDANLGGGKYLVRLENLTKSHLRNLYLTARGATRAVYNESPDASGQGGTYLADCVVEGHNAGDPAGGALIVNKSGHLFVTSTPINFGMAAPMDATVDTALVRVLGGSVSVRDTSTSKATSVAAASPFAHVSAGVLKVDAVFAGLGGSTPVVRQTGGSVNPAGYLLATS
jgi:hypothetical protein